MSDTHRLRRGFLLLELEGQYPQPLMWKSLSRRAAPFYAADAPGEATKALRKDLRYLEEKGLITSSIVVVAGQHLSSFKLTADGRDVAAGDVEHPGIEMAGE